MQRDGRDEDVFLDQGLAGAGQPFRGGTDDIVPVAALQGEHQLAAIVLIEKHRPPATPWPRHLAAIVADFRMIGGAGHVGTADIAA